MHILKFHLSFGVPSCHTITGQETIILYEHLVLSDPRVHGLVTTSGISP